jgi:hypothetical protein
MANKRMIRDWTASEKMDELTPQAEVFFTRLIMKVDDFGVFPNNDRLLRSALFPLKNYGIIEVGAWKKECLSLGLVITFKADGKEYLAIKNFDQKLRRMHHTYPPPPVGQVTDSERTSDGQVTDKRPPEVEVEEKKKEVEEEGVSFDDLFLRAFDEITCERLQMTFKNIPDLGRELQMFRTKCDNAPEDYYKRDVSGLRLAFQYQLKNYRNGKSAKTLQDTNAEIDRIIKARYGNQGAEQE